MRRAAAEGRNPRQLIGGILLAAGQSRRFAPRQKLLQPWRGEPLVRHTATTLVNAGLEPVVVVISDDGRFAEALDGLPVRLLTNSEPELGISRSIRLGLSGLAEANEAGLIAVGDQPHLTVDAVAELMRAFSPGRIVVPRYGDQRGNPPILDRRFFAELLRLEGDNGGQGVIRAHPEAVFEVSLPPAMGDDIDRPEDWPA